MKDFEKLVKVKGQRRVYMLYSKNITIFFDSLAVSKTMIFFYLLHNYIVCIDISVINDDVLKQLRKLDDK